MTDHKLMPKHGEVLVLPVDKANPAFDRIVKLSNEATILLGSLIVVGHQRAGMVSFPCKQCVRDIALMFHDLSEALLELVEDKNGCGNG